jgi:hypothetical protein
MKTKPVKKSQEKITRKEALQKGCEYAAFTAAAAIVMLSPKRAQADSPTSSPTYRGRDY